MIKLNEKQKSSSKLSTIIKHRCKINSYYYYIQIFIDAFVNTEKITFLIKSKREEERKSILYKRTFNYNDIINYNKNFKNFSSLEDIFINIAQSIEENKYIINNNLKCISLIIRIYIKQLKKYVNICINLNEHKNLHPLSMSKGKEKELKKIMMGIQNEEELSYAILDIRERLKNLEMNQTIINNNIINDNNNNNVLNNYKNKDLGYVKNYYYQPILTNSTLIDNINSNVGFNNSNNIRKTNTKISPNSNRNNFINNNKDEHNTNIISISPNKTDSNYFKGSSNNLFPKNIKINNKQKITGVNELIKKINNLETSTNSKGNNNKINYKLNPIDSNKYQYKNNYISNFKNNTNYKKKYLNKSVEISKKNNDSEQNNISQISQIDKSHIKILFNNFNKDKNMNGSKIIDENNNSNNDLINNNTIKKTKTKNKNKEKNNLNKFVNKSKSIDYKEQDNNNIHDSGIENQINKINIVNDEVPIINQENNYDKFITKNKTIKDNEKNVKKKKKSKNKSKKVSYNNDFNNNNINNINEQENGYSNNNINNNINTIIEDSSEKENPNVKKLITKKNSNEIKIPKNTEYTDINPNNKTNKTKKYSSAIKERNPKQNINFNMNNNNSINSNSSLSSKPIIKHNVNKSISSSMSNVKIKPPKKVPIYPPEKLSQLINSNIVFRKIELNLLKNKLSNNNKNIDIYFQLLYRASRDGDNDTIIKKLTLGYDDVMTLFYTNEGARFGIYIKRKKNHYIKAKDRGEKPGTSFIIGFNNLVIYDIFKNKNGKGDYNKVLCFGCLDDTCTNGTKWMIYTPQNNFLNTKCIMGNGESLFKDFEVEQIVGPNEYTIKEVEIFSVEFEEKDDSDS